MKHIYVALLFTFFGSITAWSQSSNMTILRQSIGRAGGSSSVQVGASNFLVQYSVGQSSVIGTSANENFTLRQGFIQADALYEVNLVPELPLDITLYPNPFRDILQIRFEEELTGQIEFQVIDLNGRILLNEKINSTAQTELNLSSLSQGMYLVHISANNRFYNGRIQKL